MQEEIRRQREEQRRRDAEDERLRQQEAEARKLKAEEEAKALKRKVEQEKRDEDQERLRKQEADESPPPLPLGGARARVARPKISAKPKGRFIRICFQFQWMFTPRCYAKNWSGYPR